jgi:hypothetical protein
MHKTFPICIWPTVVHVVDVERIVLQLREHAKSSGKRRKPRSKLPILPTSCDSISMTFLSCKGQMMDKAIGY